MKKMTAMVLAMMLAMILAATAMAETAAEYSAESEEEKQELKAEMEAEIEAEEEMADFLEWIGQGMETVSDTLSDGWNMGSDAVASGIDWLGGKISDWTGRAEAYMQKHQWDKKVQDAWETLKTGAQQTGEVAGETLTEAYHTVRNWLAKSDEDLDQEVAEAVDLVAEAAGVAEAELYNWYREIEGYMRENADLVTEAAREGWTLIKQNASEAGTVAEDMLKEAYSDVREWLVDMGETEDSEMMQILEEMEGKEVQI